MYKSKISEQREDLEEKEKKITAHEKMISYLKESDELRNQLMNETSDQDIKDIIFKYIVKPDMEKKKAPKKGAVVNRSVCADMDK